MSYTTNEREFALPLPITQAARRTAQQFANSMPTPDKAKQVRLNTLAVCVVNDYLQMMGISCDPTASDSWNPVVRMCADVADLDVTGVGRLECRPLSMRSLTCDIPPEVWSDRIGYVVVQIDESLHSASVLGFTETADVEELPVSQLRPVEDLIDRLSQLAQPSAAPAFGKMVKLSQWLQNVIDAGWETVESVLHPEQSSLAFSFRSSEIAVTTQDDLDTGIRRAKMIDLGMQLAGNAIALVLELSPESEQRYNILVQLHPAGSSSYLPPSVQLLILDESKAIFLEAEARSADNYIQLEFSGEPGERFSIKVALGDATQEENFVI